MSTATPTRSPRPRTPSEAHALGVEAYVYLYPLLMMDATRRQMTNLPAGQAPGFGPMNAFHHIRAFPTAEFRAVVRPNFDTLYSVAWLDVAREPMVVSVPDTGGRYYLLPLYDMWTDAFAVPGSRTSGTGAGRFVVAHAPWVGAVPEGTALIEAPTPYVWVIGRTQTNGPDDYDAVHAVQDGFTVTPLSRLAEGPADVAAAIDPAVDMRTPPLEQVNAMSAGDFFARGADLLAVHGPHYTDWSVLARMRRLGLVHGERFALGALPDHVQAGLRDVPADAQEMLHEKARTLAQVVNGWQLYRDSLGVYGNAYLQRAVIAMGGLGANQAEDAVYPLLVTDREGQPLDGAHDYLLHFEPGELPPVEAFWSVTMYDGDGFQVANAIDRYAIGDRDDLAYNDDGSLDLHLQHSSPGTDLESNWLPAPRGPLGVTMRLYAPGPGALDGRWTPPAVRRI
jgi:hypothetical protein